MNTGEYIKKLVQDYKKEPGGKTTLQEKKHWLDDDYVKFIRYAESFIEKNLSGIVAYVTNNGFLDNITFRGMRWHLMQTFDKIYILNLHGDSQKHEKTPDGQKDENIFDIKKGVAIVIFVFKFLYLSPIFINFTSQWIKYFSSTDFNIFLFLIVNSGFIIIYIS